MSESDSQMMQFIRDDQIKVVDLRKGVGAVCQVREHHCFREEMGHYEGKAFLLVVSGHAFRRNHNCHPWCLVLGAYPRA